MHKTLVHQFATGFAFATLTAACGSSGNGGSPSTGSGGSGAVSAGGTSSGAGGTAGLTSTGGNGGAVAGTAGAGATAGVGGSGRFGDPCLEEYVLNCDDNCEQTAMSNRCAVASCDRDTLVLVNTLPGAEDGAIRTRRAQAQTDCCPLIADAFHLLLNGGTRTIRISPPWKLALATNNIAQGPILTPGSPDCDPVIGDQCLVVPGGDSFWVFTEDASAPPTNITFTETKELSECTQE